MVSASLRKLSEKVAQGELISGIAFAVALALSVISLIGTITLLISWVTGDECPCSKTTFITENNTFIVNETLVPPCETVRVRSNTDSREVCGLEPQDEFSVTDGTSFYFANYRIDCSIAYQETPVVLFPNATCDVFIYTASGYSFQASHVITFSNYTTAPVPSNEFQFAGIIIADDGSMCLWVESTLSGTANATLDCLVPILTPGSPDVYDWNVTQSSHIKPGVPSGPRFVDFVWGLPLPITPNSPTNIARHVSYYPGTALAAFTYAFPNADSFQITATASSGVLGPQVFASVNTTCDIPTNPPRGNVVQVIEFNETTLFAFIVLQRDCCCFQGIEQAVVFIPFEKNATVPYFDGNNDWTLIHFKKIQYYDSASSLSYAACSPVPDVLFLFLFGTYGIILDDPEDQFLQFRWDESQQNYLPWEGPFIPPAGIPVSRNNDSSVFFRRPIGMMCFRDCVGYPIDQDNQMLVFSGNEDWTELQGVALEGSINPLIPVAVFQNVKNATTNMPNVLAQTQGGTNDLPFNATTKENFVVANSSIIMEFQNVTAVPRPCLTSENATHYVTDVTVDITFTLFKQTEIELEVLDLLDGYDHACVAAINVFFDETQYIPDSFIVTGVPVIGKVTCENRTATFRVFQALADPDQIQAVELEAHAQLTITSS